MSSAPHANASPADLRSTNIKLSCTPYNLFIHRGARRELADGAMTKLSESRLASTSPASYLNCRMFEMPLTSMGESMQRLLLAAALVAAVAAGPAAAADLTRNAAEDQ
jgi:hypothetical protein